MHVAFLHILPLRLAPPRATPPPLAHSVQSPPLPTHPVSYPLHTMWSCTPYARLPLPPSSYFLTPAFSFPSVSLRPPGPFLPCQVGRSRPAPLEPAPVPPPSACCFPPANPEST